MKDGRPGRLADDMDDRAGGVGVGLGWVGRVKAGRVHPSPPIGQTARRGRRGFEENSSAAMGIVTREL